MFWLFKSLGNAQPQLPEGHTHEARALVNGGEDGVHDHLQVVFQQRHRHLYRLQCRGGGCGAWARPVRGGEEEEEEEVESEA